MAKKLLVKVKFSKTLCQLRSASRIKIHWNDETSDSFLWCVKCRGEFFDQRNHLLIGNMMIWLKKLMNYKLRSLLQVVMANPKLFVDFFPSNLTIALYITFSQWAWNSFSLPSSTNNQCVLELQHGKRELEPLTHESRIGKKHACFLFICRLWLLLPINATSRPDGLSGKKE